MSKPFLSDGTEYIRKKIDEAIEDGSREARICGNFEITDAISIPSNFKLILDDCHLRLADGVYSNVFVNESHGTELGKTPLGRDKGISIIGVGEAIIDGGKYNGLSERNTLKDGRPPIWKNNLILFTNVEDFRIENISCVNQRWWAINLLYCSHGYLGGIHFEASDIGIDENGKEYHGLIRDRYDEVLVKNADGIDLRQGCHDITIENITGFTEDDTIALTGLNGTLEKEFKVEGLPSDISNVTIRNIKSSAFCTIVRLLNQGDIRLHDIVIDGVLDTGLESTFMDHGLYAVRIGDTRLYGERHSTSDETYNITVKNVWGGGDYVLSLAGSIRNLTLENINALNNTVLLLDERI